MEMSESKKAKGDNNINAFCDGYYEKIYRYSLKKTGSKEEAEDLTSEIAVDVISSFRRDFEPEHFSAWVWQIARNKYGKWVQSKMKRNMSLSGGDISDFEDYLPDDNITAEDLLVNEEEMSALKRELAFLPAPLIKFVVAFYIENKKVEDISRQFNLPLGTVKTRLYQSRKILKEGMEMAREFGKKSYAPENLSLCKSGNEGYDGSPWSQVGRMIPKNILIHAYEKLVTIEELATELGISVPYMEEEVKELFDVELLAKVGEKYQTNFVILDAETQIKINNKASEKREDIYQMFVEKLNIIEREHKKTNSKLFGGYQSFDDLKWLFLLRFADNLGWSDNRYDKEIEEFKKINGGKRYTLRPRNGFWDMFGCEPYEQKDSIEEFFVGLHGTRTTGYMEFYKINYKNLQARAGEVNDEEVKILIKAVKDGDFSDKETLDRFTERGFFKNENGKYIPTFPVICADKPIVEQSVPSEVYKNEILPIDKKLEEIIKDYNDFAEKTIKEVLPERFKNKLWFCMEMAGFGLRGFSLRRGMEDGILKIPENIEKSTMGMYMCI